MRAQPWWSGHDLLMDEHDWPSRAAQISTKILLEAARKQRVSLEAERDAVIETLHDARLGACRMDGAEGPECWCGKPSSYSSGECEYHGTQALRAQRCETAERERDLAVTAKLIAEKALPDAEARGRLIGEWLGVLVHTDGMAALLDRLAHQKATPADLHKEAELQRKNAGWLRSRPPRPADFSLAEELREFRRTEADAAVAVLRHRERYPDDVEGWKRLHALWLNAAARTNAAEVKLAEATPP